MFIVNDDMSIYATRGDIVFFAVAAMEGGEPYIFKPGDVVRFKAYEKKSAESVVLVKAFNVVSETDRVEIFLSGDDTKFGDVISKPTDYWYEVELNPFTKPQTIIGYDEDGAKIFRLYPEGADVLPDIDPDDFPVVDSELDPSSERPVQNQVITRALSHMVEVIDDAEKTLKEVKTYANHMVNYRNPHKVTALQIGATTKDDVISIAFSRPGTTTFNEDGSITVAYDDGSSEVTVFNEDGSITSTRYKYDVAVKTATTTFNADGSITVKDGE